MREGMASRSAAYHALLAVFKDGMTLDYAMDEQVSRFSLNDQDRAFAYALCTTILRHKPSLQKTINGYARRKNDITPIEVNIIVLMGTAQLLLMQVEDHAAIDTSVTLTEVKGFKNQKGLANALLRRVQSEQPKVHKVMPKWLYDTWVKDYGEQNAKAITKASLNDAPIGVVHKNGTWEKVDKLTLTPDVWVQDYASHLPVTLLGDITDKHVFDLCAAPGGKTMQLASKGAKVTAVDISSSRLKRLNENVERTGLSDNVTTVCADLLKWNPEVQADIVVLDAPCSATGTLRRHPDLPYIRTLKDVKSLVALQYDLLNRTKKWVKDGGVLLYCTCSLQKDEGEHQIDRFLKSNLQFERVKIDSYPDGQTAEGDIRLLPSYGDMDGFFIALLRKKL